jgi:hypothetical protein
VGWRQSDLISTDHAPWGLAEKKGEHGAAVLDEAFARPAGRVLHGWPWPLAAPTTVWINPTHLLPEDQGMAADQ